MTAFDSIDQSFIPSFIPSRRYGYEALLDNEFHGAADFHFTPYAQKVLFVIMTRRCPSAGRMCDCICGGGPSSSCAERCQLSFLHMAHHLHSTVIPSAVQSMRGVSETR